MNLTEKEERLFQRLQKEEANWPKARWLVLLITIASFCLSVVNVYFLVGLLNEVSQRVPASENAFLLSLLAFKLAIYFTIFVFSLGIVLKNWRGNARRMLLLKLLDGRQIQ